MKFVPTLLLLALGVATFLFKNYADARRVELLRQDAADVAALRTEIRTLHRQLREAEASATEPTSDLSPQATLAVHRLGDMADLIKTSFVQPPREDQAVIPFFLLDGKTINPAMATLFALSAEQMSTLSAAYRSTYAQIRQLAKAEGQSLGLNTEIVPNPAMQIEHQKMRDIFKQTLGVERYSLYETLGCPGDDMRYLFHRKIK